MHKTRHTTKEKIFSWEQIQEIQLSINLNCASGKLNRSFMSYFLLLLGNRQVSCRKLQFLQFVYFVMFSVFLVFLFKS